MNNVTLTGRLTKSPVLKYTAETKTPVAEFRLAVNDFDGAERVDFFDIVQYGKRAEALVKHVDKGRLVGVTGKLRQEQWTDKDTKEPRSRIRIKANDIDWFPQGANGHSEPVDEPANSADHDYPPRTDEDPGHVAGDEDPELPEDLAEPSPTDEPF